MSTSKYFATSSLVTGQRVTRAAARALSATTGADDSESVRRNPATTAAPISNPINDSSKPRSTRTSKIKNEPEEGTAALVDIEDVLTETKKRKRLDSVTRPRRTKTMTDSTGRDSTIVPVDEFVTENTTKPSTRLRKAKPASLPDRTVAIKGAEDAVTSQTIHGLNGIPKSTDSVKVEHTQDSIKEETLGAKAPPRWREQYDAVMKMRQPGGVAANAAVDTMGCERLADRSASPRDQRFHTLIALMLSSQTKDTVNAVVMKRLQTELPAHAPNAPTGLNLENILAVEPDLLNQMIWAVGFHNNKTKYIKKAAEILRDQYDGDIPDTIAGLTSLPGVGPKMAHLCLSVAWQRTEGIGVDVHVHRITNLWGWHKTTGPEQSRLALESWLPREKWHEINWLLVGFGQSVCLPVGRQCGKCDLAFRGLCRAVDRKKLNAARRVASSIMEAKLDLNSDGQAASGVDDPRKLEPATAVDDSTFVKGEASNTVGHDPENEHVKIKTEAL